jgi:peptidoglycan/xylan/chitin deacetylase (PgdA/CDA1 family)
MADRPQTLVTFDYEGKWGMPYDVDYDLRGGTNQILEILQRYNVSAVFFVVGRLVEEEPDTIATIASAGHEIGLHGYRHEKLQSLTPPAAASLQRELAAVCHAVEELSGSSPVAFRAPYLLGPGFSDPVITQMLGELGFEWVSNREVRFPEELFRPDRVPWPVLERAATRVGALTDRRLAGSLLVAGLNARHAWREGALGSPHDRFRWLLGDRRPFGRSAALAEVALGAPLDCDLLGLPYPTEASGERMIEHATRSLISGAHRRGQPYVLTFHDWIISSANRLQVLDQVLAALTHETEMLVGRSWRPRVEAAGAASLT